MIQPFLAHADCLKFLRGVPSNFFDACVTDPPYEIGLLNQEWDKTGISFAVELWREVLRVLKPGSYLVCFAAPKRYHRVVSAIEDAGFEVQDMRPWLRGGANALLGGWVSPSIDKHLGAEREVIGERVLSGTAAIPTTERGGTHSIGVSGKGRKKTVAVTLPSTEEANRWDGYAWQLKGVHEACCLAIKPPDGSRVASLLKWGTGALNLAATSLPAGNGTTRCPPNVDLDPEAAQELGWQSGETKCGANKQDSTSSGAFHGSAKRKAWSAAQLNKGDTGTAARYFPVFNYCRKANKIEKGSVPGMECPVPSVKPEPLIEDRVKLVMPPGSGRLLDPFAGSGTTLVVASRLGYEAYGIEKKQSHYDFALARSGAKPWETGEKRAAKRSARRSLKPTRSGPQPFIKWVGGKSRSVPDILSLLPEKIDTYHERFLGSAALFWALASQRRFNQAVLSDLNRELVETFRSIQRAPEDVLGHLADLASEHSAEQYYWVRAQDTATMAPHYVAARFIYLNKTCFNGLYRVNRSGRFNAPIGKTTKGELVSPASIVNDEVRRNILDCSNALQGVVIECASFNELPLPGPGDAVYLDPPYIPLSKTSSFTAFQAGGFNSEDHRCLAKFAQKCRNNGATVLVSNSDTEFTRELYAGWGIRQLQVGRTVNSKPYNRGKVNELLITSTPEEAE